MSLLAVTLLNNVTQALVVVPTRLFSRILQWIGIFMSILPLLLVGLSVGLFFGIGVGYYGDVVLEETEYFFRCVLFPLYEQFVRPILQLLRLLYNPLICWWNAINWWSYGIWFQALIPTFTECGITTPVNTFGEFLLAFFQDFIIDYITTVNFLTQEMDFTNICAKWITFWEAWQNLIFCSCSDLSLLFRLQPILLYNPLSKLEPAEDSGMDVPVPTSVILFNPLYLFGADQLKDPQFWCFISNLFNTFSTALHVAWRVFLQIITLQPIEPRPIFDIPIDRLCTALACFMRSTENVLQLFTDNFIPFTFNFENFLCVIDTGACIVLKIVALLLKLIINIDQVVFYPTNTFFGTVIKDDFKLIINLIGPVNYRDYGIDPNITPSFNGTLRLSDCLCIFISRLVCDPTNTETACFDSGAQEILGSIDFDICCLTTLLLRTIGNTAAFLFELLLNLNNLDLLFSFIDDNLLTWLIKDDIVDLADCILNLLGLIPVVGPCIKVVLVQTVRAFACYSDFFVKLLLGIATLPYWIIIGQNNFILQPQRARDEFVMVLDVVAANGTNTWMNCLCFILNGAFPIPYIPCTSCQPTGFMTPVDPGKRFLDFFGPRFVPTKGGVLQYDDKHIRSPKEYVDQIYANSHDFSDRVRSIGDFQLQQIMNSDYNYGGVIAEKLKEQRKQFKQSEPAECPQPYQPVFGQCTRPDCFDFCCIIRTTIQAAAQILKMIAFGADSLIHQTQGPTESNYFVNGDFEMDLTRSIELGLLPLQCICNFIEFVFPIPNLDLCCAIREIGNFVSGILLIIINSIKSLALDNPNFTYFTTTVVTPNFRSDINALSDLSLVIVQCLCDVLRAVLPIPVLDICCFPDRFFSLLVELIRWLINTIVNLALINSGGMAYFATGGGFATEGEVVITTIFGTRGGCCNQGTGGIINCFCGVINAIFPFRQFPGEPVSGNNCQVVDLCCAINEIGFFLGDLSRFTLNLIVSFFQPWVNGIPTGFVEFWVCNDLPNTLQTSCIYNTTSNAFECINVVCITFVSGAISCEPVTLAPGCGRLAPLFDSFRRLLECPCVVLGFLDQLISQALGAQWECFCGTSPQRQGIVRSFASLVLIIAERLVEFIRLFVSDQYWKPTNWPCPQGQPTCSQNERSFALFLIGRIVDELCDFIFSLTCFLDAWFGLNSCFATQRDLVFAVVRWPFEFVIRIIDLFTGLINAFINGCGLSATIVGGATGTGTIPASWNAIQGGCIGGGLSSLLSFVVDVFIADGDLPTSVPGVDTIPQCGSITSVVDSPIAQYPIDCSCYAGTINDAYQCVNPDPNAATSIALRRCYEFQPGSNSTCLRPLFYPTVLGGRGGCLQPPITIVQGERLNGILIALLRHITCLLANSGIAAGTAAAKATEGLTVGLSFLWQLSAKIFVFIGNLVDLGISLLSFQSGPCNCWTTGENCEFGLLCYPFIPMTSGCAIGAPPRVQCSILVIFDQIFRSIVSFFQIFFTAPVIPPTQVPLKRMTMEDFRNYTDNDPSYIDNFIYTLWGFDTSDCMENPVVCVNRNLGTMLKEDFETTGELVQILDRHFSPNNTHPDTTCQQILHMCAVNNDTWDDIGFALKTQYIECLVQRIRGERIHEYIPAIPADLFYNYMGPIEILDFVHQAVNELNEDERKRSEKRIFGRSDDTFIPGETQEERCSRAKHHYNNAKREMDRQGFKHEEIKALFLRLTNREHYIRSGEFIHNLKRSRRNIRNGQWEYPIWPQMKRLIYNTKENINFLAYTNYRNGISVAFESVNGLYESYEAVRNYGFLNAAKHIYRRESTKVGKVKRVMNKEIEEMWDRFYSGPIYQWWNSTDAPRSAGDIYGYGNYSMSAHIRRVIDNHKRRRSALPWNYMDGIYAVRDSIYRRWTPKWTPKKLQNWEAIERVFLKGYHAFFPNDKRIHIGIHERFIFNCNCKVADRALSVTTELIQYCASQSTRNSGYLAENDAFVEFANRNQYLKNPNIHFDDYSDRYKFNYNETKYLRPRIVYPREKIKLLKRHRDARHRRYNNLKSVIPPSPTGFYFIDWIICRVDDLLNLLGAGEFSMWLAQTISDIQDWILNENTDPTMGPVGLKYWTQFFFECKIPENTNCSMGIGLESALGWILLISLVVFVGIALFIPSVLLPLSIGGLILIIIVFGALGFGWSPRCALMTPAASWLPGTIPFSGSLPDQDGNPIEIPILNRLKQGIDLPFWPFPIAYPALPECLMDEILALFDKYITNCYDVLQETGLSWLIPPYMINGLTCPTCPVKLKIFNCRNLGMGDGITNLIYLLNWIAPGFCDFIMNLIGSSIIFQSGGFLNLTYVLEKLTIFKNADMNQTNQFNWCFWATVLTLLLMFTIVLLFFLIASLVIEIVSGLLYIFYLLVFNTLIILFYIAFLKPLEEAEDRVDDNGDENGDEDDDDDDDDDDELKFKKNSIGMVYNIYKMPNLLLDRYRNSNIRKRKNK